MYKRQGLDIPRQQRAYAAALRALVDDPATATYERFDPLFWGNGLNNWWFGANGAYSWLNANLRAQRLSVGYVPVRFPHPSSLTSDRQWLRSPVKGRLRSSSVARLRWPG